MSEIPGVPQAAVNEAGEAIVQIKEEYSSTGGHYQTRSISVAMDTSTGWHHADISFPIPISLLTSRFYVKDDQTGDEVRFEVAPDTITGAITSAVTAGDTVINVSQTVIDNVDTGFFMKLADGTNTDDLGRVITIDDENNRITVETAATHNFSATTPTYVKQTIRAVTDRFLIGGEQGDVGSCKIGGSYIPANKALRSLYKNNSGIARTYTFHIEYLY